MESRHAGRRGQLPEVMIFIVLEGTMSTPGPSQGGGGGGGGGFRWNPPFGSKKKEVIIK